MTNAVTTLAFSVLGAFAQDTRRSLTIRALSKEIGVAYPGVHATVGKLLAQRILVKRVVGHSHLCGLDLENPQTGLLLAFLQAEKLRDAVEKQPPLKKTIAQIEERGLELAWMQDGVMHVLSDRATPWITHAYAELPALLPTLGGKLIVCGHARYAQLLTEAKR